MVAVIVLFIIDFVVVIVVVIHEAEFNSRRFFCLIIQ